MATPEQVAALRPMIADNAMPYTFENTRLSGLIDASGGDLRKAASSVWELKAAEYAELVDTTEGSSSRKMSQLKTQALEMAKLYAGGLGGDTGTVTSSRTRVGRIVRPEPA